MGGEGAEWKHGAAGTVSGILTRCTVAPLDVIKIRLQLQAARFLAMPRPLAIAFASGPPSSLPHTPQSGTLQHATPSLPSSELLAYQYRHSQGH